MTAKIDIHRNIENLTDLQTFLEFDFRGTAQPACVRYKVKLPNKENKLVYKGTFIIYSKGRTTSVSVSQAMDMLWRLKKDDKYSQERVDQELIKIKLSNEKAPLQHSTSRLCIVTEKRVSGRVLEIFSKFAANYNGKYENGVFFLLN